MPITFQNVAVPKPGATSSRGITSTADLLGGAFSSIDDIFTRRQEANQGALDRQDTEGTLAINQLLDSATDQAGIDAVRPEIDRLRQRLSIDAQELSRGAGKRRGVALRDELLAQQQFDSAQLDFAQTEANREENNAIGLLNQANERQAARQVQQQPFNDEIAAAFATGDFATGDRLQAELEATNNGVANPGPLIIGRFNGEAAIAAQELNAQKLQTARGENINAKFTAISERIARNSANSSNTTQGIASIREGISGHSDDTQNTLMGSFSRVMQANPQFEGIPSESAIQVLNSIGDESFFFGGRDAKVLAGIEQQFGLDSVQDKIKNNVIKRDALEIERGGARAQQAAFFGLPTTAPDEGTPDKEDPEDGPPPPPPGLSAIDKKRAKQAQEIVNGEREEFSSDVQEDRIRKDAAIIKGAGTAVGDKLNQAFGLVGDIITAGPRKLGAAFNLGLRGTTALGFTEPGGSLELPDPRGLLSSFTPGLDIVNKQIADRAKVKAPTPFRTDGGRLTPEDKAAFFKQITQN